MNTSQTTKNVLSSATDIEKSTLRGLLLESKDSWGKSYDLFRCAFSAIPYVATGYDSSFTIHIKHVLFKMKRREEERRERRRRKKFILKHLLLVLCY